MSREAPLVELRNLEVRFRTRQGLDAVLSRAASHVTAVDDVSLAIRRGEVFGLVGESGSGKTTLGKAVLRLVDPTAGAILFEGHDIARLSDREMRPIRRHLQTVFQDPLSSLNPRHTVERTLATPLRLHRMVPDREVDAAVDRLLERVGLSAVFRGRYAHELSGGQLQRVAIGRALALEPSFLVADEAVSKLDVSVRAQILNLFRDIQADYGMSILFITHDLHVARYLCTRIGVMYFGKLVELAPTEELFSNPRHPYTQALLATLEPEADGARPAAEAFSPGAEERIGCRFHRRCPLATDLCRSQHPPVESVLDGHDVACHRWRETAKARRTAAG